MKGITVLCMYMLNMSEKVIFITELNLIGHKTQKANLKLVRIVLQTFEGCH